MGNTAAVTELLPRIKPRTLTFGECLILELAKVPRGRGLTAAYERIVDVVGEIYGTRNTFGKLQLVESYASLEEKDRMRAWLLMATLGMNPEEFGANDAIVPSTTNKDELRRLLDLRNPLDAPRGGNSGMLHGVGSNIHRSVGRIRLELMTDGLWVAPVADLDAYRARAS